jgi:thioredoxin reductase (NADPH)
MQHGEVIYEQGDSNVPLLVVISGELEIVNPSSANDTIVMVCSPGQFTGEVNTLSGRRALFKSRASRDYEIIELDRQQLLALIQNDVDLGRY